MAGLASLASMVGSSISEKRSLAYLTELKPGDDTPVSTQAFQYFPESLSDSKSVNWTPKEIPGGSLPLYQWSSSGERSISFTAYFSTDIDQNPDGVLTNTTDPAYTRQRLESTGQLQRNVDVRSAVTWLRQYMLPKYTSHHTLPPPKLLLYLPKSGIGIAGGETPVTNQSPDTVLCVMTQCEITWEKFFPSGNARIASVALSFAQVPQYQGVVSFPQVGDQMTRVTTGEGATYANTTFTGYKQYFGNPRLQFDKNVVKW